MRHITYSGLQPRTLGGLRGFGFTISFHEPAPSDIPLSVAAATGNDASAAEEHRPSSSAPIQIDARVPATASVEAGAANVAAPSANNENFARVPLMGGIE